jgi:sarcosine oxidase delta subunit
MGVGVLKGDRRENWAEGYHCNDFLSAERTSFIHMVVL